MFLSKVGRQLKKSERDAPQRAVGKRHISEGEGVARGDVSGHHQSRVRRLKAEGAWTKRLATVMLKDNQNSTTQNPSCMQYDDDTNLLRCNSSI